MKRLVYAPKVWIFVRSFNMGGTIYDVSSDVVNCTVTQNCDDVSSASFTLRNRYGKWIRDFQSHRQIFLPMDMVTIWMQRIAGRPIQIFTGYLDTVPYYQGLPTNASFEATCTLKKLAYTWFDPGLMSFQQFIMSTGQGWTYDPTTGEAVNPKYLSQAEIINGNAALTPDVASGRAATVNDGGFAELLGRFVVEVAGWDPSDVLISDLPSDIPKMAARLYADIHTETQRDLANLENFLSQVMGVNGWSSAATPAVTTSTGTQAQTSALQKILSTIKSAADSANVPVIVPALAAFMQTGYNEDYSQDWQVGFTNWGYGMYALQPSGSGNPTSGTNPVPGPTLTLDTMFGYTTKQLLDATVSTQVFCKLLNLNTGSWVAGARNNDVGSIQTWIEKALGRSLPSQNITAAFNKVKTYLAAVSTTQAPLAPTTATDPNSIDFTSVLNSKNVTPTEQNIIKTYYMGSKQWLAAFIPKAKAISPTIQVVAPPAGDPTKIAFYGSASDILQFLNSISSDTNIDLITGWINGTAYIYKYGQKSSDNLLTPVSNTLYITESSAPPSNAASGPTSAGATASGTSAASNASLASTPLGNTNQVTLQQLASFSANAAFAANFSFPANFIESEFLTGDRALMNDQSCLDGVKQFCQASLRSFRSLPDGRFLAFYPDYFGATRGPYWSISDIEILNFGIQLNDDSLATHVYVVGDTFAGDGQIDYLDEASTRGVATIVQAFMLNSFIVPPALQGDRLTPPQLGGLQDAYAFLQHYGARPHREDQPIIRNTFYEFLLAWQRFMQLWAQQFATSVEFTFQPEVMAGGLIAFPDHGIQMYCQSVTHTCDYEGGFTTTATLTSPSLIKGTTDTRSMPGFALGGNVNTVGAAS